MSRCIFPEEVEVIERSDESIFLDRFFSGEFKNGYGNEMIGDKIGEGVARQVYEWKLDKDLVIKIQKKGLSYCVGHQNIMEYMSWLAVKKNNFGKYFAPCIRISPCGGVLLQRRVEKSNTYPDVLPEYLTDTKRGNYGILDGQFVCCDYGTNALMEFGMTRKMKKVIWSD